MDSPTRPSRKRNASANGQGARKKAKTTAVSGCNVPWTHLPGDVWRTIATVDNILSATDRTNLATTCKVVRISLKTGSLLVKNPPPSKVYNKWQLKQLQKSKANFTCPIQIDRAFPGEDRCCMCFSEYPVTMWEWLRRRRVCSFKCSDALLQILRYLVWKVNSRLSGLSVGFRLDEDRLEVDLARFADMNRRTDYVVVPVLRIAVKK